MYKLAVIGAGQLGSRHLQALCALKGACRIDVVDPAQTALDDCKARVAASLADSPDKDVAFHTDFSALSDTLDYAVVATTSHVRLRAMQSLLENRKVKALVLEKVLFDQVASYAEAESLITAQNIPTWVNCTRREYAPYQALRDQLAGQPIREFSVIGGAWGLGCNGIHFIDLLAFLSGCNDLDSLSTAGLDAGHIDSKRPGYIEFTGSLSGTFANGTHFSLTSRPAAFRHLIQLRTETLSVLIDEVAQRIHVIDEKDASAFHSEEMKIPFLSEIMTRVVESILESGRCALPTLAQSTRLHRPFIAGLARHIGQPDDASAVCKIT